MCGRTACTLAPNQLCKACGGNENRRYQGPAKWRDVPGDVGSYSPRYNLGPSIYSPVLVSGHHFAPKNDQDVASDESDDGEDADYSPDDLVVQPMLWGLIPSYHKGEPKEFRYKTINARAENVMERQTFRVPLSKGRRCVVLADGFYEWKRSPKGKQPYFIYFPQENHVEWDRPEQENGGAEWTGRRLLTMAGIFEINRTGDYPVYTYTIITIEASKTLEWMHDRMPALLDGDDAVDKWLDSENVPLDEALALLKPVDDVSYHPVPVSMGNIRNQGPECILPVKESKTPAAGGSQKVTLDQFFKRKAQPSKQEESSSESSEENGTGQKLRKP